jgi:tRNA-splicing endonuclease subunit Sen54
MADTIADEDAPISSLHNHAVNEDNDPSDEVQDFRFLSALSKSHQLPKRGEKDFEPHGTKHQDSILEASRQAMHEALDYTRVHVPKSDCRAWYFGEEVDGSEEVLTENVRGKGLTKDHVVMVEHSKGTHYRTMGKTAQAIQPARMWLLPEEALYLIERGNLDIWWLERPRDAAQGLVREQGQVTDDDEDDDGLPLSLEAAYALLIGEDGQRGKVCLEKYNVYANLKRTGYVVFRHLHDTISRDSRSPTPYPFSARTIADTFTRLFGGFFSKAKPHLPYGPLVQPGLYRSYTLIYQELAIIPRHKPAPLLEAAATPVEPLFELVYDIWKPSRIPNFAKSNPGVPDFRVAVVSSRSTSVPTLAQLGGLLESTPWDPPPSEWATPDKTYQRLKHGWRNVVLAVVDQGIISYLRLCEAAFGEERMYERFDKAGFRGGKKGGGRGRGRGRGRGKA